MNKHLIGQLIQAVLSLIVPVSILMYLKALNEPNCNCVRDWRYNAIKFAAVANVAMCILSVVAVLTNSCLVPPMFIMSILGILQLINVYALFTYVGDLNKTHCVCVVDKHADLNSFLYVYRYVPVFMLALVTFLPMFIHHHKK
jgi:hypothetical protein